MNGQLNSLYLAVRLAESVGVSNWCPDSLELGVGTGHSYSVSSHVRRNLLSSLQSSQVFLRWLANRDVLFLFASGSSFKSYNGRVEAWCAAVYGFSAIKLWLCGADVLYSAVRHKARIIFIGDASAYGYAQLVRLNYMCNPRLSIPTLLHCGDIRYYFRGRVPSTPSSRTVPIFDLAVVCVTSMAHVRAGAFDSVASQTIGIVSAYSDINFFDYPLPVLTGFNESLDMVSGIVSTAGPQGN